MFFLKLTFKIRSQQFYVKIFKKIYIPVWFCVKEEIQNVTILIEIMRAQQCISCIWKKDYRKLFLHQKIPKFDSFFFQLFENWGRNLNSGSFSIFCFSRKISNTNNYRNGSSDISSLNPFNRKSKVTEFHKVDKNSFEIFDFKWWER